VSLAVEHFEGFDADAADRYLRSFDNRTRKKGESYFRSGAVESIACQEPGRAYSASVLGGDLYQVSFFYDAGAWDADCSCPVGYECKHAYAAWKKLLAAYSEATAAPSGVSVAVNKPNVSSRQAGTAAGSFAALVQKKLGRELSGKETTYLQNVNRLFRKAAGGGLNYVNELTGLGLPNNTVAWWDRLELYPRPPRTEAEFWNYLALYLTEKAGRPLPEFIEPVTDVTEAKAAMSKAFRARDIQRWNLALSQMAASASPNPSGLAARPVELRARLLREEALLEWRADRAETWTELKRNKADEFEAKFGASLSAEASLLWLPWWHRLKVQYFTKFNYADYAVAEQVGRWLRQPLLRPLLAAEDGGPLTFHAEPLRWRVRAPDGRGSDYAVALVRADDRPAPKIWLAVNGSPTVLLTDAGVFPGPPLEPSVLGLNRETLIPPEALETHHGLRLLDRLQAPLPPRLASRIRDVALRPGVRAEVKHPWPNSPTEYCYVDVLGASDDGEQVEYWNGNAWVADQRSGRHAQANEFVRLNRAALPALIPPLEQAGFKWDVYSHRWQLRLTRKFAETFVAFLKALPPETRIELGGDLASFQNAEVAGKIRLEASEAETDWFDLRVVVDVGDTTLTPAEIKLLLDAKGNWVRLERKGWRKLSFALSEAEDQELARLGLTPHQLTSEPQRLHAFQLADQAARKFLPEETCERIERRVSELQARVTPELPGEIQAELRPYQRDGFHFLAYLAANRFGGILADDMGLGKTLQTLAWLAWLRGCGASPQSVGATPASRKSSMTQGAGDEASQLPSLVVCPKSVADNWHAEATKFFPALKVRVWTASELKSMPGELASADLHVLNYSQLRLVGEDLARERFLAVILDEGQYIKNPSSQTAQIARQLRAGHRLILSGTPIENRLLDLWSLMNFAMPGALGNRAEFQRLYDAKNDPFARQRLSARVRPFLIRRTKAQVARDLPDRVEEDLYCELEGEQKTLYRAELKRAQAMLLGVKTATALNKQRFNFLTSLLRLRQICCHPKLVKPRSQAVSAKVEALMETLEPLMEEGEKVLVFSQFVELLDILRGEMKARGWQHWHLAGDTENRGELVKQFQSAAGAGVFLISLKAGGFGLNLTAASYVVLFDPWWNPAVENQAIDRTHRIGQTCKVIAYRLLIKDSIEEKIRALQKRKKSLAEDVLGEEKFSQGLSLDDLRFLLA
jgi:superfamily II DNA or RNA helicase